MNPAETQQAQPNVALEGAPAGQDQQQSPGLYPDLTAVPEDIRETVVMPLLKAMEGNVTRKFQEAADFRKQWEPYQQMGLHEIDQEELQELLAFREVASDPESFRDWHRQIGEMFTDEDPAEGGDLTPDNVAQAIEKALDQRLGPIEQSYQQQAQQQAVQQAQEFISGRLDALQGEHGEFDRDAVCQLALAYEGENAVEQGFADYQRIIGAAEKGVLSAKLNQPNTPEQGGRPATQAQPVTSFADAKQLALAQMQQANSH